MPPPPRNRTCKRLQVDYQILGNSSKLKTVHMDAKQTKHYFNLSNAQFQGGYVNLLSAKRFYEGQGNGAVADLMKARKIAPQIKMAASFPGSLEFFRAPFGTPLIKTEGFEASVVRIEVTIHEASVACGTQAALNETGDAPARPTDLSLLTPSATAVAKAPAGALTTIARTPASLLATRPLLPVVPHVPSLPPPVIHAPARPAAVTAGTPPLTSALKRSADLEGNSAGPSTVKRVRFDADGGAGATGSPAVDAQAPEQEKNDAPEPEPQQQGSPKGQGPLPGQCVIC